MRVLVAGCVLLAGVFVALHGHSRGSGGGSISGLVTGGNHPLGEICVEAGRVNAGPFIARTGPDGRYTIGGLPPGRYEIQFVAFCAQDSGSWLTQWYRGITAAHRPRGETLVKVLTGHATTGINATLIRGGQISGIVTSESGRRLSGVCVNLDGTLRGGAPFAFSTKTAFNGGYADRGLFPGTYRVNFAPGCGSTGSFAAGWWPGSVTAPQAGVLTITGEQVFAAVSVALRLGAEISGTVRARSTGRPLSGICVNADSADGDSATGTATGPDGRYTLRNITTGRYTVVFQAGRGCASTRSYGRVTTMVAARDGAVTRLDVNLPSA